MARISAAVEIDLEIPAGMTEAEAIEQFKESFTSLMQDKDSQFWQDYGPEAWGGYDGPKLESVEVSYS